MKKNLKKGDGLATVVITIVLIAVVLLIVPVLRAYQANSGANLQSEANATTSIVGNAVTVSESIGYDKIS